MKNSFKAFLLLTALITGLAADTFAALPLCGNSVFCFDKSAAYEHYTRRPRTEFSKLMYLKDVIRQSNYDIIYNGKIYDPDNIISMITMYMRMNYKKEKAENWIERHAYRSASKGQIIYLRDLQGKRLVLKDVLLQELRALPL